MFDQMPPLLFQSNLLKFLEMSNKSSLIRTKKKKKHTSSTGLTIWTKWVSQFMRLLVNCCVQLRKKWGLRSGVWGHGIISLFHASRDYELSWNRMSVFMKVMAFYTTYNPSTCSLFCFFKLAFLAIKFFYCCHFHASLSHNQQNKNGPFFCLCYYIFIRLQNKMKSI